MRCYRARSEGMRTKALARQEVVLADQAEATAKNTADNNDPTVIPMPNVDDQ